MQAPINNIVRAQTNSNNQCVCVLISLWRPTESNTRDENPVVQVDCRTTLAFNYKTCPRPFYSARQHPTTTPVPYHVITTSDRSLRLSLRALTHLHIVNFEVIPPFHTMSSSSSFLPPAVVNRLSREVRDLLKSPFPVQVDTDSGLPSNLQQLTVCCL